MKSKLLLSALAVAAMSFQSYAGTMSYTYGESDELYNWGLKTAQTYDVAIELGTSFADKQINTISIPVMITPNMADFKVWMSSALAVDDVDGKKVIRTDVMNVDVTPAAIEEEIGVSSIEYTLPENYTIPAEGVYVGYSFTVKKVTSDYDRYPVLVSLPGKEGGLFLHTSKTYRSWKDRATEVDAVSPIVVTLEGDFPADAVSVGEMGNVALQAGEVSHHPVTVFNLGSEAVASVGYTLTVDGVDFDGEYKFDLPIVAIFNRSAQAIIEIPALETGIHEYTLCINKVNGKDNAETAVTKGSFNALDVLPVKRPLMEEFTGTWCGWCPRGWVGMEKMNEFHPDFVSIAYHNGDKMQIADYPVMESGYPSAFMDRSIECDPYYGINNKEFGIEELWQTLSLEFAPAEIQLKAEKSEDGTKVTVTSDLFWAVAPEAGDYRIEYVLVGDGLSDPTWVQTNNYSSYGQGQAGIYMDLFCKGGEYGTSKVAGLTYNDVALINTGGKGVAGSIESIETGSHSYYTHTFDLSESAVIDKAQSLNVVAMILKSNSGYGKVINSNKVAVQDPAGISSVTGANVVSEKYYDLSGRVVVNPEHGIYIKSVKMSDGRIINTKVAK